MNFSKEIEEIIDTALEQDIQQGDVITQSCIPSEAHSSGHIILRQAGVVAGLPYIEAVFKKIDPRVEVTLFVNEGSYQKSGTLLGKVQGPTRAILTAERTALNLIQHASGIATITSKYVRRVAGYDCAIMDTRKTLPSLRGLEKYAVTAGGGVNYRLGLDDRFLIKINHLNFVATNTSSPITSAVQTIKKEHPGHPIDVEIDHPREVEAALQAPVQSIMLKNMLPHELTKCVRKIRFHSDKKIYVESAGTITLETIRSFAETGVDGILVGALTDSVHSLHIALRLL